MRHAAATLALFALTASQDAPASIEGRWVNPSHSVIIDIAACGENLCGIVAWASAQAQQDARKGADQLVGTQLLTNLQQKGAGWRGKLFIPDEKMRVTASLQLVGDQQLKVSGCALGKSLCKSQVWSRAKGPLPNSD